MRYERTGSDQRTDTRRLSRRATLLLALFVAGVVSLIVVLVQGGSNTYARVEGSPQEIRAVESNFLKANNAVENLAAPQPVDLAASSWLFSAHPLAHAGNRVIAPAGPWISPSGHFVALTSTAGRAIVNAQSTALRTIFSGAALAQVLTELDQGVSGELGRSPQISGAGGARIDSWLRVSVTGSVAHLEADVDVWVATPTLSALGGGRATLLPSVNANRLDVFATMVHRQGGWRIISFNQAPWQQAT